jgi:hypothetical protein
MEGLRERRSPFLPAAPRLGAQTDRPLTLTRPRPQPIGAPILYAGYTDSITKSLLTSAALKQRIRLLAERKVEAMQLNPGEDREKVVRRVEKGLEGVARRMSATLIAKVSA